MQLRNTCVSSPFRQLSARTGSRPLSYRSGLADLGGNRGLGEVEVHDDGFRAEFARPSVLYVPFLPRKSVRKRIAEAAECHGARCVNERRWCETLTQPDNSLSATTVES